MTEPMLTAQDLIGYRGAPFSQPAIDGAVDAIRTACEWHIAPEIETTQTLQTFGTDMLVLDSLRVVAVTKVVGSTLFGDAQPLDTARVRILDNGIVYLPGGFPEITTITYRHGFTECPDALKGIVAERALSGSQGRVKSESLAGRSIALADGYDPAGEAVLSRYRLGRAP